MRLFKIPSLLFLLLICAANISAEIVADGVEYETYTTSHPNNVYVLKMDRSDPDLMIHMGLAQKRRNHTRQNVQTIASIYDSPPDFDVLGAVNGSFFAMGSFPVHDAMGSEGSVIQGPGGTRETLSLTDARVPRIINRLRTAGQTLYFDDGTTMEIDQFNYTRMGNSVALYTPYWGPRTGTTFQGVEIVVSNVNYPARGEKWFSGVVTDIRTGAASVNNVVPPDAMVISARDSKATELINKVSLGERIEARIDINYSPIGSTAMMITGRGWLLDNGVINEANWVSHPTSTVREPRTCIAWNDTDIFLVAIDGRRDNVSVGMNFTEMAVFLRDTLGATDGLNLDGGGSTTMVVDGEVKNQPSGGIQRNVSNALMVVKKNRPFTPVSDSFPATGRQLDWDEMVTFNPAATYNTIPPSPTGDQDVMHLTSTRSDLRYESASVGNVSDANYAVEADIYCDYLGANISGDEIGGIFARDDGTGMWDYKSFNGGHAYIMAYATDNGFLYMGKVDGGVIKTLLSNERILEDGWHTFRIECEGDQISYYLDGALQGTVTDTDYKAGRAGVATSSNFVDDANKHGLYVDNFKTEALASTGVNDWALY